MLSKIINVGILSLLTFYLLRCTDESRYETFNLIEPTDTTWKLLSIREKIGQVVCYNYNAEEIKSKFGNSVEAFLKEYPVGSVFIASWGINYLNNPDTLANEYRNIVNRFNTASKYPLLFSEDFEQGVGGSVHGLTALPGLMSVGASNSKEIAKKYAQVSANESRSIGINWLLNPVADLNINPSNHITNARSLTDNPEIAIKLLPEMITTMQERGVAATVKHFPGDGTDYINQHFTTSRMVLSFQDWKKQHGRVFKKAIDSGVMVIMPGHITFPAYQKKKVNGEYLPATLSHEIQTDLLKKEMGFNGVIVSDAYNMAGIANYYESRLETEIEGFKSGTDILLWPSLAFMDTLEVRIERGEIPMERLDDAVKRVWHLKEKLGLFTNNYQSIKPLRDSQLQEHENAAQEIANAGLTLIDNKNQILPLQLGNSKKLKIITLSEEDKMAELSPLKKGLEDFGFTVELSNNLSYFSISNEFEKMANTNDYFIFVFHTFPGKPWGTLSLKGEAALTKWTANLLPPDKVISISFGDPYKNLIYMHRVWGSINAYNLDEFSQRAVIDVLTGKLNPTAKSPVTIRFPYIQHDE